MTRTNMTSRTFLRGCLLAALSLAPLAGPAFSADEGVSGGQFLRIGVDARSAALGETGAALSGAPGLFYNPAGLAEAAGPELFFSHARWIGDTGYSSLAFAGKRYSGVVGAGISYLDYPSIDKYDKFGNDLSATYSANDAAVMLGYGRQVAPRLDLGFAAKYISSRLETANASALALDGGLRYCALPGKLDFGLAVQNFGGPLKFRSRSDPLPLIVRLGGAYRLPFGRDRRMHKSAAFFTDVNYLRDAGVFGGAGVEMTTAYDKGAVFAMRLGYRTAAAGGSSGVSAGLGMDMSSYLIDYAYSPMGDIGNTHRVSVTVRFGRGSRGR